MNYNSREEIEEIYKWDLTTRFKTDNDWEKELKKVKTTLNKITDSKNRVLESENSLFNALESYFNTIIKINKLYCYASSKNSEQVDNSSYSLMLDKITSLFCKFTDISAYLKPEILKGSKTILNKYISSPTLKKYKFYLSNLLREKDHELSEIEEKIVSKLTATYDLNENLSNILTNATLNFGTLIVDGVETELLNSNYRQIITNKNRNTRKEAYEMLTSRLKEYEVIYGMNLVASMKNAKNVAEVYKFKSVLEMDLFTSNIPVSVVNNLYKTIEKRLDIYQKYFKMVKRSLALESLEYFDTRAELVNTELTFTVEETKILLTNSLAILGEDYVEIINKAFDERWIDFGIYKGKTSNIYATTNYGNNPLILTNYYGKFNDVSALAHELGHAANFYLSAVQASHEANNDIIVAEVASLTNEILFSNYIAEHSKDKDLKLTAISNVLHTIQDNLFDACIEGKLENEIFAKLEKDEEINHEILSQTIYDIRKSYYGNEVKMTSDAAILWVRRMHYFSPYYLFKYATGVSCAVYIAKNILAGNEKLKTKYLEFLTKGESNYPLELLKEMGIDLTKPKVINEAIDYMDYLIDEFNRISEE